MELVAGSGKRLLEEARHPFLKRDEPVPMERFGPRRHQFRMRFHDALQYRLLVVLEIDKQDVLATF